MAQLNPGDIRKFTLSSGNPVIGIWCGNIQLPADDSPHPYILTLGGNFFLAPEIASAKSVRLAPEVRQSMEQAAKLVRETAKYSAIMQNARIQMNQSIRAAGSAMKMTRQAAQVMTGKEFEAYMLKLIAPAADRINFDYAYRSASGGTAGQIFRYNPAVQVMAYKADPLITVEVCRDIVIDRNADPGKYPFLYRGFGNEIMVGDETDSYKQAVKMWNAFNVPAKRESDTIINTRYIRVGKNGELLHTHAVGIQTELNDMTKDGADKLCARFRSLFKIEF